MNNWAWALVSWFALDILIIISQVGKPREPLTPEKAVVGVLIWAVTIFMLLEAVHVVRIL